MDQRVDRSQPRVVRPAVQSRHLVGDLVPGGKHEDGGGDVGLPQLPGHLQAVQAREHPVEHNDVVLPGEGVRQAVGAVVGEVGQIPLLLHNLSQGLGQARLILHN